MYSCPSCGQPLTAEARFCPKCGRSLEAPLVPGSLLKGGDYRIVRSLTKGGMGAVFLAEDKRAFDRLCVVKQMLEYYDSADPEERRRAQQRFEEEGRTLSSLSHPGIPQIYAFFSEGERFYIVMEYIRGDNLESFVSHENGTGRIISGKRLPQEEIIRYIIQVCATLEYLHSQPRPVVHQDIKPANLILEQQRGEVRLVDFGTARVEIPEGAVPGNGAQASVYGTDGYAAPEQYRGKPEPRSDVFAVAASAYHLLTDDDPRDHPFKFPHLKELPRELAAALDRALRATPNDRISARELRQALETLVMPRRTLEAFTFPGGTQIRSVGALPALSDEHWDAARSFLYNGDFQRWLRDINRHDLVLAADKIVAQEANHDAGLETFLREVDPGLPDPKVVADPTSINLGSIARESALIQRVTMLNATRGYTLAEVSSSQPWLEVHPTKLHLWAGIPTDVRVNVRAEDLPLRSEQAGVVTVRTPDQAPIEIPVSAHVSLSREIWRIARRAITAAFPESWRTVKGGWRLIGRVAQTVGTPIERHPWLLWVIWVALGAAIAAGLYYLPADFSFEIAGIILQRPASWMDHVVPVVLAPPLIISVLWLSFILVTLVGGAILGALRGAWRSFFR